MKVDSVFTQIPFLSEVVVLSVVKGVHVLQFLVRIEQSLLERFVFQQVLRFLSLGSAQLLFQLVTDGWNANKNYI